MDHLEQFIAPETKEAIRRFGLHKVAAKMYGVEEINEEVASSLIGNRFMTRLAEWRQVQAGLTALKELGE